MLVNNKINFLQAIRRYLASYIDSWVCFFAILSSIFAIAIIPAFIIAKKYNIDLSYYLSNDVIKHSFSPDVIDQFVISNWKIILIGFVVAMIAWFILDILFRTLMLYWFDNTLGKMLFSLQILSTDNSPLTFKRLWKREFKKSIFATLWFIIICIIIIPIIFIIKILPKINKLRANSDMLTYAPNTESNNMWLENIILSIIVLLLYAYLNFRNNVPYWDKTLNTIVIHKNLKWYGTSLMIILPICIIFGNSYWF